MKPSLVVSGSCLSQCLFQTHKIFLENNYLGYFHCDNVIKSIKCFQSKMSVKTRNPPQLLHVWKHFSAEKRFFYVMIILSEEYGLVIQYQDIKGQVNC